MIIRFTDSDAQRHEWNFRVPTVAEAVLIEDELGVGVGQFMEQIAELRGHAVQLLLRILYKREGVSNASPDGDLDLDIELTELERRSQARENAEEIAPFVAAVLRAHGLDPTDRAIRDELIAAAVGKDRAVESASAGPRTA
ncbi:MAG TPA: hypothetical protein VN088_16255 [Nocardioides sp.]|nr:hypothetical protein [Nocardioides sp.]